MTGAFSQIRRRIADHFKERGVDRLVYFHCDHFEPWSHVGNRQAAAPANVDDVVAFADQCSRIDFARKLTLFYKPNQNFAWDSREELLRARPDDPVGFVPVRPSEEQAFRQAMRYLVSTVDHGIQLHIHHEGYTSNSGHTAPERIAYSNSADALERDADRLVLAIRLARQAIRKETDIELKEWFFVHGLWALQGSDASVCRVADELGILKREGCLGDFTFPAGRIHVNPKIEVPYFCDAIQRIRGYDEPDSNPEAAFDNCVASKKKFFVWASRISHEWNSLDYYNADVRRRLENPEEWAAQLIDNSYYVQGTLFFKTHAHSMQPEYREASRLFIPPHAHPGIQALMSLIFDAAALADVDVKFATAPEVYDLLVNRGAIWNPDDDAPERKIEFSSSVNATTMPMMADVQEATGGSFSVRELELPFEEPAGQGSLPKFLNRHANEEAASSADEVTDAKAVKLGPFLREGMPKSIPLALTESAERLNRIACEIMTARIEKLGVNDSGAYSHYMRLVEAGKLVKSVDIAIVGLLDVLPRFEEYHEVRAGLGVLTMLIASSGRAAVAIESDTKRHAGSLAISEALAADFPEFQERAVLLRGRFPQIVEKRPTGKSLAIFADAIATIDEDEFIAGIGRYSAALIDIDRFGVQLTAEEERRSLLLRFRKAGLESARPLLNLESQGRYYLISTKPIEGLSE